MGYMARWEALTRGKLSRQYNLKKTEQEWFVWKDVQEKACFLERMMAGRLRFAKTCATMSFGQVRAKWRCLAVLQTCTGPCWETTKHNISTINSYQLSSTVVEGWWFGLIVHPQDLGTWQALSQPWTSLYTCILWSQMWGHLCNS